MTTLEQLPSLVVLGRLPVPVVAISQEGDILFANEAFAAMIGQTAEVIHSQKFHQIFHSLPVDESAVSVVRTHGGLVVDLRHKDGSIVHARMSKSALLRGDDQLALATFEDLTERLWLEDA